jgi:uncharacterized protein
MKIGLGTAQFGLNYGISNESSVVAIDEVEKIIRSCIRLKLDYIDTAQSYGDAEEKIGNFSLTNFKVITKIKNYEDLKSVRPSVIKSLANLKIKVIFGVMIHDFEFFMENQEVLQELIKLQGQGFIEKIGFSLYYPNQLNYLLENNIYFDFIQVPYNILDRRFEVYFDELKALGKEIHVRSVFLQGLFFMNTEKLSTHFNGVKGLLKELQNEVNAFNTSMHSACLRFVHDNDKIDCVLVGVTSNNEFLENINSLCDNTDISFLQKFKINDENILLPFNWK